MSSKGGNYAEVPTTGGNQPYQQEFTVADSAVRVIVDESDPYCEDNDRRQPPALLLNASRKPINLEFCPTCTQKHVRTKTRTYPGAVTWACVAIGAVIFFPLCWIPLVVDPMKKTDHFCQSCGSKIGTIQPLEGCCVKEEM